MKTVKTMVVGVERGFGNFGPSSIVGLILRGANKEELKAMLSAHKAVIIRKCQTALPRKPRRKPVTKKGQEMSDRLLKAIDIVSPIDYGNGLTLDEAEILKKAVKTIQAKRRKAFNASLKRAKEGR